jgi:hypothetical protein
MAACDMATQILTCILRQGGSCLVLRLIMHIGGNLLAAVKCHNCLPDEVDPALADSIDPDTALRFRAKRDSLFTRRSSAPARSRSKAESRFNRVALGFRSDLYCGQFMQIEPLATVCGVVREPESGMRFRIAFIVAPGSCKAVSF